MKHPKQNFQEFIKSPVGTLMVFVVLFYALTFAVYYFYSPGPEERKQAEMEIQNRLASQQLQNVVNGTEENAATMNTDVAGSRGNSSTK